MSYPFPKYRKKPVVVQAIQVIESLPLDVFWNFVGEAEGVEFDEHGVTIETLEGRMLAHPGDWIIRGVQGELYPCKPDIFAATYEPCGPPSPASTPTDKPGLQSLISAPSTPTQESGDKG